MKKILILILLLLNQYFYSQQYIKIMTYNIHDYTPYNPTPDNPTRLDWDNPALKYVINYVKPDILVCQEVRDLASVNQLMNYVLDNNYAVADFVESENMNSVLFYKEDKFISLGNFIHPAETRPFNEFPVVHRTTNDTLIIFSVHLKANSITSDNSENIRRRGVAADSIRKRTSQLPSNKNFIILGDFNTLLGSEPAIQKLIDKSYKGYVLDPLDAIGEWGDNPDYAFTHTMYAENLTVRFDMILISQAVKDPGGIEYVENSYTVVGNDGKHFGKSINYGLNPYQRVLADSLISASDHLPVYAIFKFTGTTNIDELNNRFTFHLNQNYPNPFNSETTISYSISYPSFIKLKVYDLLGNEITTLVDDYKSAGNYQIKFNAEKFSLSSGIYFYKLVAENFSETRVMVYIK
ncbi:T9SS type A sorting domain-containing protein [Rosettibacter firmus]|uniref:T9SS type A sorting domain-containing protein n=1 Tax=Rosettibacter firmus TaxID=3111522 RepID=UPI00336BE54E